MTAMPSLNGSVGYIFTSCDLDVKSSGNVRFKDMIDHFRVYDQPRRPEAKEEVWLGGERVDARGLRIYSLQSIPSNAWTDYLLYGRFYLPTGRLDALYSTRLTPTIQAQIAAISEPQIAVPLDMKGRRPNSSNIMINVQHDIGKWCSELTWSAEDGMWGVRVLRNFGRRSDASEETSTWATQGIKRVDEEEALEGGLRGRVSMGAEFYISAQEKSAGGNSVPILDDSVRS